jgi:hypothetical protein
VAAEQQAGKVDKQSGQFLTVDAEVESLPVRKFWKECARRRLGGNDTRVDPETGALLWAAEHGGARRGRSHVPLCTSCVGLVQNSGGGVRVTSPAAAQRTAATGRDDLARTRRSGGRRPRDPRAR